MTALKDKIYANIVEQLTLKLKSERLQQELQAIERRGNTIVGRMSAFSELFEEAGGGDLQEAINKDPEWKQLIERAQAEAEKAVAEQAIAGNQSEVPQPPTPPRPVKAVAQNKQPVSKPQPAQPPAPQPPKNPVNEGEEVPSVGKVVVEDASAEAPKPLPRTETANRKEPIKFTIDDKPPAPPAGTPTTDLDDDD